MSRNVISLRDFSKVDASEMKMCKDIQAAISNGNYTIINLTKGLQEKSGDTLSIFEEKGATLRTGKYVGVLQYGDAQVIIGSRFDEEDKQHFLRYAFERYFEADAFVFQEQDAMGTKGFAWEELLAFVFVKQLKTLMRKGFFRQYRQEERNDDKVRGQIDIARHIRENPIFNGRVAYSTRVYTVENPYNILVLKAYEKLKKDHRELMNRLISNDSEIKRLIQRLQADIPNWQSKKVSDVLRDTRKKIVHPVYRKMEPLCITARLILSRNGVNVFGNGKAYVSGIVFDMTVIWEKFVEKTIFDKTKDAIEEVATQKEAKVLKEPGNEDDNGKRVFIPDFYWKDSKIVIDTKYKETWGETIDKDTWAGYDSVREDVFQVFAYMYALECKIGGVLFPLKEGEDRKLKVKEVAGPFSVFPDARKSNLFYRLPYYIPNCTDYDAFCARIEENQKELSEYIIANFN